MPPTLPISPIVSSCLPYPLDGLRDTNVVGLELVQANADRQRRRVQRPPRELAELSVRPVGNVVGDDGLEAQVGVDEDRGTQDGVHGGVDGAGREGSEGERDEAGSEEAVEGPVVGAVGRVRLGDRSRVVDCDFVSYLSGWHEWLVLRASYLHP